MVELAGLYLLVSVGVRVSRGQWARSAAGVSTDVQEIDRGAESLRDAAAGAQEEIDELKDQLEKYDRVRREVLPRLRRAGLVR